MLVKTGLNSHGSRSLQVQCTVLQISLQSWSWNHGSWYMDAVRGSHGHMILHIYIKLCEAPMSHMQKKPIAIHLSTIFVFRAVYIVVHNAMDLLLSQFVHMCRRRTAVMSPMGGYSMHPLHIATIGRCRAAPCLSPVCACVPTHELTHETTRAPCRTPWCQLE